MKRLTTIATEPKPKCFHHPRKNGVLKIGGAWFCAECRDEQIAANSKREGEKGRE
jgi:hypothetical protein